MNVNKRLKWTMAWRKEKVTPIVKDSYKWREPVKANELFMLLGNLETLSIQNCGVKHNEVC